MALNPLFPHPQTSALTSSLEREPMLIPKYEYGDPVLTMEMSLPTDSCSGPERHLMRTARAPIPKDRASTFTAFFLALRGPWALLPG